MITFRDFSVHEHLFFFLNRKFILYTQPQADFFKINNSYSFKISSVTAIAENFEFCFRVILNEDFQTEREDSQGITHGFFK